MAKTLEEELRQTRPFAGLEEATFLSIQRTASVWMQAFAHHLKPFRLTPTQYNVLRILRGAHPGSLTCGEIGERMVTEVPDVTRLIDRLVARRLAWKARDERDRRVVRVEISGRGLELLADLDDEVLAWLEELVGQLDQQELETLCKLSERARRGAAE
ncbi:MAG: MarR family winged helix-turn-helix transcriptional regulator [Planctomycetota bacterium]|jgi:DNA-binding MarR family transcriptional regulator